MFEHGVDNACSNMWPSARDGTPVVVAKPKQRQDAALRDAGGATLRPSAARAPHGSPEHGWWRPGGAGWPARVIVLPHGRKSCAVAEIRVTWADGVCSHHHVVLPAPGSMDIYVFCAWLEAEVKKQAGVDPFTQMRFTCGKELLELACSDAVSLPISAAIRAGRAQRIEGALARGKKRCRWAARVSLRPGQVGAPPSHDPTVAALAVSCAGALQAPDRELWIKSAPGKNSSVLLAQCAWLLLEPHPRILPVSLTAGPNLFLFVRAGLRSTNAAQWLSCAAEVVSLDAAARRRLVCAMLLQVAMCPCVWLDGGGWRLGLISEHPSIHSL